MPDDLIPTLSDADVWCAAAYRVIFEQMNPQDCTTQEARNRLAVIVRDVMQWAQPQPYDIKTAYQAACAQISKLGDQYLENNNRARRIMEIHRTLPKPPPS